VLSLDSSNSDDDDDDDSREKFVSRVDRESSVGQFFFFLHCRHEASKANSRRRRDHG
jgi:hypothetical protein